MSSDDVEETSESEPQAPSEPSAEDVSEASAAEATGEPQAAGAGSERAGSDADADEEGDGEEQTGGPGLGKALLVEPHDLAGAVEALVLVSDKPVPPVRLARLTRSDLDDVKKALAQLEEEYADRGIVLDEVAGGYQFRTHPRYAPVVRGLIQQKPTRLTRAQLEVLSIIAYRQPVTRPEIEDVRGVDSGSALRVLLERGVIRIIGKKDEAGRPMLYATTPDFLSLFGLKNLRDLPTLKEFTELSDDSRDMFERRIGERPPLEGFTEDAQDLRSAAEREAALRAGADDEDEATPPSAEAGEAADDGDARPGEPDEAQAATESPADADGDVDVDAASEQDGPSAAAEAASVDSDEQSDRA